MTDVTEWREQVKFPDQDAIDWKAAWERDKEFYDPNKLSQLCFVNGCFERLHALMGFEEALVALILEPESTEEFHNAMMDFRIDLLDHLLEYYPIDHLTLMDDYGHHNNSFMSAEQWEAVLLRPMKKLTDYCKKRGVIFELHSCGFIEPLIPSLLKAGVEHWNSCQPVNDLKKILHE